MEGGGAMLLMTRPNIHPPEKMNQGTPWQDHSNTNPRNRGEGSIALVSQLALLLRHAGRRKRMLTFTEIGAIELYLILVSNISESVKRFYFSSVIVLGKIPLITMAI